MYIYSGAIQLIILNIRQYAFNKFIRYPMFHMSLYVPAKIRLLYKRFSANTTLVRFHFTMRQLVSVQARLSSERFTAYGAGVRFYTSMKLHVNSQM